MENYDDIRPYTDSEIPAAMHRIVHNDFSRSWHDMFSPTCPRSKCAT